MRLEPHYSNAANVREYIILGLVHQLCDFRETLAQLVGDRAPPVARCEFAAWAKIVATRANMTRHCPSRCTHGTLRMKCTRQRYQLAEINFRRRP